MSSDPRPQVTVIKARPSSGSRTLSAGSIVVESAKKLASFGDYLREMWERRSLVQVLAGRQLKSQYTLNIVGFGWWLLEPISLTVVYFVLFTKIFQHQPAGGIPYILILLAALLPFKWLSQSLIQSMNTVRANASLVTDVYFPRALLPITETTIGLAHFGVALLVLPVAMLVQAMFGKNVWGGPDLVFLPVVVAVQLLLTLGLAYPLAVVGLNYRNLPGLMNNLLRLWFYMSPSIWTLDLLVERGAPDWAFTLVRLNPLTGIFEGYRRALLLGRPPGWELAWSALVGAVLLVGGLFYFTRREAQFGKML